MEVRLMFVSVESSPPQKICGNPMENQKEKLREPRRRYTLCVMWNEGNPKEVANCGINGKNILRRRSEAKKRLVWTPLCQKLPEEQTKKKKKKLFEEAQIGENILKNENRIWQ